MLKQYQEDGEKSVNLTAKRLLLFALGVDVKKSSLQLVNTVDISQIEELVDQAVQKKIAELIKVDSVDTAVKTQIADSLADGIIGDAIAKSYAAVMGQFNELLHQMEELKAAIPQSPITSPQSPVPSPQSPVTSPQSPKTEEQKLDLIELLGVKEIVEGAIYYKQLLLDQGIDDRIKTNTKTLENLGITFNGNQRQPVAKLNFILTRLGYQTKNIGQKTIGDTRGIECYQVQLP